MQSVEMTAPPGIEARAAQWQTGSTPVALAHEDAIQAWRSGEGVTWIHYVVSDAEAAESLLINRFSFHELAVRNALEDQERPTVQNDEGTLFISAHAVEAAGSRERYIEVGFFLSATALVTVVRHPAAVIGGVYDRWLKNPQAIGTTPAGIVYSVLDEIVDEYFPAADAIEDRIDALTESLFRHEDIALRELVRLKRRLLEMRRHAAPLRDTLNICLRRDLGPVPDAVRVYFQDVYDHTLRIIEMLDSNREILASILDAHLASVSNSLNEVMRKMTVIATILMSMALISGIYGMNFDVMPELKWGWGYPFALALMILVASLELVYFRRKKWI